MTNKKTERSIEEITKEALDLLHECIQHTPIKLSHTKGTEYDKGYIFYQDMVVQKVLDNTPKLEALFVEAIQACNKNMLIGDHPCTCSKTVLHNYAEGEISNPAMSQTPEKSIKEIVGEFKTKFGSLTTRKAKFGKPTNVDMATQHWLTRILEAERQKQDEVVKHAEEREKQLKTIHTTELDAVSCMSIEEFLVWRDNRKQQPNNNK